MSRHAYPTSAMMGDYARAAAGLVPATALLVAAPTETAAFIILSGLAAIFGAFGVRTALRHGTRIEATEHGLRSEGPLPQRIDWCQLDRMKLAYYSTRRDGKQGWMQLELGCRRARVRLDSRINGFGELVERSAAAAAARNLSLSQATVTNLQAMGVTVSQTAGAER